MPPYDLSWRVFVFGIGSTELVVILVFGFLLFGPDKLPQMGRTIGRALRQFRETQEKLTAVVQTEVVDPMAAAAQSGAKKAGVAPTVDEDADADAPAEGAAAAEPARKETFAERRARLAAEKAEAEAAKAAEGADEGEATTEAVTEASEQAEAADAPVAEEPAVEEPAVRTTEDLYARRPRKRKQAEGADDAAPAATSDDTTDTADTEAPAQEGGEQ